jgi:hypothetical protein
MRPRDTYFASVPVGGQVQSTNGYYDIVFTGDAAGTGKLNIETKSYNPVT